MKRELLLPKLRSVEKIALHGSVRIGKSEPPPDLSIRREHRWQLGLLLLLIFCCFFISCASPGAIGKKSEENFNPLKSLVQFYRGPLHHLESVRRGECPMYPSCSQYSLHSFEKHGLLIGWMMTCDRLMRCGRDETRLSPKILANGKVKTYDPVERNDFWWNHQ